MSETLATFEAYPWFLYLTAFIFGASVGSFLNVVIYRLPIMMKSTWKHDCQQFLELPVDEASSISLSHPASACPYCDTKIKPWHNLPIVGWLWLRGKCAQCASPISLQYPLVELFTALVSVIVIIHFGATLSGVFALIFTWGLIALAGIDIKTTYLPDSLTLSLLWLGLLLSVFEIFIDSHSAIIGAAAGYLSFWLVFWLFKLATGKEGMGYGDFKLLAALGAWLGWQALPIVILLASVTGVLGAIAMAIVGKKVKGVQIPFGPYLAIAGWLGLLWGTQINHDYLRLL